MQQARLNLALRDERVFHKVHNGTYVKSIKYIDKLWAQFPARTKKETVDRSRQQANASLQNPSSQWVLRETPHPNEYYDIRLDDVLGTGAYGTVCTARRNKDGKIVVCKIIRKCDDPDIIYEEFTAIRSEAEMLYFTGAHRNIVAIYEVFENKAKVWFMMEYLKGGTLNARIKAAKKIRKKIPSKVLKKWFHQMMTAVCYLHAQELAHCDIKPDNFAFESEAIDAPLKLIDFGFTQVYQWNKNLDDVCGTPHYMAPEVPHGNYGSAADIWSMGACLFFMYFHFNPFYTRKMEVMDILKEVQNGFIPEVKSGWGNWFPSKIKSKPELQDLIKQCLTIDVRKRPTAEEVLDHPWLKGAIENEKKVSVAVIKSLVHVKKMNSLQKLVLAALLKNKFLTTEEIRNVASTFKVIDTGGKGRITWKEFQAACKFLHEDKKTLHKAFDTLDIDHNHILTVKEFFLARVQVKVCARRERLLKVFNDFKSKDRISLSGILRGLKKLRVRVEEKLLEQFFKEITSKKDIFWKDFIRLFNAPT